MIPLRDDNPTRRTPIVTYFLILINIVVYLYQIILGSNNEAFIYQFALIPANVTNMVSLGSIFNIFTSMFMHGGWMHFLSNMWILFIFGDNVEDRMGHFKYLIFYIAGVVVASLAHIYTNPGSQIPTVDCGYL